MAPKMWGLLVLACVFACQPIPRPFVPAEKGISFEDQPIAGHFSLFLDGIDGVSDEWETLVLTKLSFYLEEMGILSSRHSSNRVSMILRGHTLQRTNTSSYISWQILDPTGEVMALFEQSYEVRPELMDSFSRDAAFRIKSLLVGDNAIRLSAARKVVIFLSSIDGAPGDGKFSLRDAMRSALGRLGVHVASELPENVMSVLGSVSTTRFNKTELVEVRWSLIGNDGVELASVVQSNSVPKGSLDGEWGDSAKAIAESGAQSLALLIENYTKNMK